MTTLDIIRKTKAAWSALRDADAETKNRLLTAMADSLVEHTAEILTCNEADLEAARGRISDVMLDRLRLDESRIAAMAEGIRATVKLPDHTGRILSETHHANGMTIYKKQVPLGLVAIIYESRPNVTSDAAALTVKSGNVCVLRSGKEAVRTSTAIVKALKQGISAVGGDPDIVNILEDTSHESARVLMTADGLVDLLIPRGGAGLIRACVEQATVPCIQTGTGICHVYVDEYADLDKAVKIIVNAKTSRPSVCNAEEVCLVHRAVAERFLPMLRKALVEDRTAAGQIPVELRLDPRAAAVIPGTPAGPADFDTEFLDYILAVRVVDSVDEAIEHIQAHSTHHSDAFMGEISSMVSGLVKTYEAVKGADVLMQPECKVIGSCPACGSDVCETAKGWFCRDKSCKFALWKENRFFQTLGKQMTEELAKQLVNRGKARLTHCYSRKSNRYYDTTVHVETGEDGAAAFKLEFGGKK